MASLISTQYTDHHHFDETKHIFLCAYWKKFFFSILNTQHAAPLLRCNAWFWMNKFRNVLSAGKLFPTIIIRTSINLLRKPLSHRAKFSYELQESFYKKSISGLATNWAAKRHQSQYPQTVLFLQRKSDFGCVIGANTFHSAFPQGKWRQIWLVNGSECYFEKIV